MNRYYETLRHAADEMAALAKKLDGPRIAKDFTPREKQLIRLAVEVELEHDLQDHPGQNPL